MCVARLALLILLLGVAQPSRAALWSSDFPELELPQSMQLEVVSDGMQVNGLNTRILKFHSQLDPDQLAGYFTELWAGSVTRVRISNGDVLSHRDGDYLISVQVLDSSEAGTSGLISVSDIFAALEAQRSVPSPDVPMLSGSRVLQFLQADDVGRVSETVVLTNTESAHQNLAFYRSFYHDNGYVPLAHGALARSDRGGAMILNRGAEQLNLAVAESRGTTVITIVRVRQ